MSLIGLGGARPNVQATISMLARLDLQLARHANAIPLRAIDKYNGTYFLQVYPMEGAKREGRQHLKNSSSPDGQREQCLSLCPC